MAHSRSNPQSFSVSYKRKEKKTPTEHLTHNDKKKDDAFVLSLRSPFSVD
jgi:hypothetical protein